MASQTRSFISFSKTGTDAATPLTDFNIYAYDVNIHCYTNATYYGDGSAMGAQIAAGSVASFRNVNLHDIMVKNVNAGNNASIYVAASVPNAEAKKFLGVPSVD